MKIIDLLNKIANGEEVPLKIEYKGEIYNRQQNTEKNSLYYYQVLGQCKFLVEQLSSVNDLIDEVEIIEEDKEIKKLNLDKEREIIGNEQIRAIDYLLEAEINELIDKVNSLENK